MDLENGGGENRPKTCPLPKPHHLVLVTSAVPRVQTGFFSQGRSFRLKIRHVAFWAGCHSAVTSSCFGFYLSAFFHLEKHLSTAKCEHGSWCLSFQNWEVMVQKARRRHSGPPWGRRVSSFMDTFSLSSLLSLSHLLVLIWVTPNW